MWSKRTRSRALKTRHPGRGGEKNTSHKNIVTLQTAWSTQTPGTEIYQPGSDAQNKGKTMTLKIFSIRDSKGEVFNTPFFQKTHGEAERNFRSVVNDGKTTVSQYPDDFDLYYLGEYDDNKGTFTTLPTPQHVAKAVNMIAKNSPAATA